jgi:hypothetical protein
MDQQISTGSESGARLEPIGENWAPGVGPVRLGTGSGRLRWAVALGVVLIVSLVTLGGAFVLSGAGGAAKSLTAGSAPKESVVFVDLRADLPGDQHQKLADLMSHFPGFKDRAQFDGAFDDILNQLTSEISPDLTYTSAFKAWTTGEVSIAITNLGSGGGMYQSMVSVPSPDPAGSQLVPWTSSASTPPSGVVIVALTDRAAGERWVSSEVSRTGLTFKAEDYAGAKVYVAQPAATGSTSGLAQVRAAYSFTDKVLLLGTEDAVKAGLDAPSKGSLAGNSNYQAAMKSLSGDSIATFYVDPQALMQQQTALWTALSGAELTGMMGGTDLPGMMGITSMPAWLAGSVRAEPDHMSVEITMPKTAGALSPVNAESVLASQLPGSTVGVMEIHSVGKLVNDGLKAMSGSGASTADNGTLKMIQDALTRVGGIDWLGDADLVLTKTDSTYGGGIVVKTPDAATATSKKAMLTNLVALAGGSLGITSADETYKGTTITRITVPNGSGTPLEFSIATKNDLIVAGYEDSFVKAVLDTTAGTSLAASANYQTVMAAVGPSNAAYGYFDISAVADQIGQTLSGNASYYNLNYKPYVDHFGGAAFAEIDGSTVVLRFVVTAK